ncbi:ABC transporter permease subunit [Aminipila butyrica]|uniref:ABC transporter permease subunit n=1 Tax=Aminipila butyrica TaxID=433296 RepID=A0A858BYB8_9FIRM|nr:ABC transporter permease subunit [Aminipila butyrica]QIB70108.1 ABC transporter permease subunit [Aminipila butyrica]
MKKLRILLIFVFLGLLWEGAAWAADSASGLGSSWIKLPYLHHVLLAMFQERQVLWPQSISTLVSAGKGFLLGALVGVLTAITMSGSRWAEKTIFPYLILAQMLPVLGLAPMVFGMVRDGDLARVIIAAYITFFPVSVNMLSGLKSAEKEKRELMYSYSASKIQLYSKLLLPSAVPGLFTGLKIAAPLSITSAILVEIMGANSGVGILILRSLYYGSAQAANFWATVLDSACLGIFSYIFIVSIERAFARWTKAAL